MVGEFTTAYREVPPDEVAENDEVNDLELFSGLFDEITESDKKLEKVISKTSLWREIINNLIYCLRK